MDDVTICIPVFKRHEFLRLTLHNIKTQTYPHNKLTVLIDECFSDQPFVRKGEYEDIVKYLHPIKVIHKVYSKRATIGEKRNRLVKASPSKYIQFFDSDDYYRRDCILYNHELLKTKNVKCVGSDKMIFCYTQDEYKLCAIDCGNQPHMIHEATLFFEKKWFRSTNGFLKNSKGEGQNLFQGVSHKSICISDIGKIMMCLVHSTNTVKKDRFKQKDMPQLDEDTRIFIESMLS